MQYGHFDNKSREYVIDRVDLPVSWTNYIGVGTCTACSTTRRADTFCTRPQNTTVSRVSARTACRWTAPGTISTSVDDDFRRLAKFWDDKLSCLQISTPNEGMNTEINIRNLYQSEINVMFSRFTSFIEVGGRVGLGYRDTAQDAMMVPHSNPAKCRSRIVELMRALTNEG